MLKDPLAFAFDARTDFSIIVLSYSGEYDVMETPYFNADMLKFDSYHDALEACGFVRVELNTFCNAALVVLLNKNGKAEVEVFDDNCSVFNHPDEAMIPYDHFEAVLGHYIPVNGHPLGTDLILESLMLLRPKKLAELFDKKNDWAPSIAEIKQYMCLDFK